MGMYGTEGYWTGIGFRRDFPSLVCRKVLEARDSNLYKFKKIQKRKCKLEQHFLFDC